MKERQRWTSEEDALLYAYVKQYGPREWYLVSQRMNTPLNRDAKSCLERWKNYLKPGIKRGSLTEEEQRLVIQLQAKHGNRWKKIAAEVPGRTAKRLGKWWEVFKEKQQRELKENSKTAEIDEGRYDRILETFAEKLVKAPSASTPFVMATPNGHGGLIPDDAATPTPSTFLPPWLSNSNGHPTIRQPSPSVTLSLSPSTVAASPPPHVAWPQHERVAETAPLVVGSGLPPHGTLGPVCGENILIAEMLECCRELEEGRRALELHRKEAAWRLSRLELQLESEKSSRKSALIEEIESKIKVLREEQKTAVERIENDYKEQLASLRKEAEAKEQKLAEQWAVKHSRLTKVVDQMLPRTRPTEANGR